MLKFSLFITIFNFVFISAYADQNNSQLTTREQQVQDSQKLKNELNQASEAAKPNAPSAPTQFKYDTNQIDSTAVFEINNHLFGYSTLLVEDNTYHGIKITGLVNVAYYNPSQNNDSNATRKKGRFVFGFESPVFDITTQLAIFGGIGATLGDARGIYLDAGLDYRVFQYLKLQAGLNYNSDAKIVPQLSIGLTW